MKEIIESLPIDTIIIGIWTAVLLPILTVIGKKVMNWMEARDLDKYGKILYTEVKNAVMSIYETQVKDLKKASQFTPEKQQEVKEMAKTMAIQALTTSAYKCLKEANTDFNEYLDGLVGTALYDLKNK